MTVGLAMIVRDEAAVIERCLLSLREQISHWVVVDTGSVDGTQELVCGLLAGVPGGLYERPWVDFGWNRTEALELAAGTADYLLMPDADFVLGGTLPAGLKADAYMVEVRSGPSFVYGSPRLTSGRVAFGYAGVTHEHLSCPLPYVTEPLRGAWLVDHHDGGSRVGKYERDIRLLTAAVAADPLDARSVFYLARSHDDVGDVDRAVGWYRRRAAMGGWDEEVYYSLYRAGCLLCESRSFYDGAEALVAACRVRPGRAEALRALSYVSAAIADRLPATGDVLFVDRSAYGAR